MVKRKGPASPKAQTQVGSKRRKTNKLIEDDGKSKEPEKVGVKVTRSSAKKALTALSTPEVTPGPGVHPLLIDHILDKIFQYVVWPDAKWPNVEHKKPSEDVCNIRLVCKQWNETGTRLLRRGRSPTTFGSDHANRIRTYEEKMHGFLDVMKTSTLIPVQRYVICANFFIKQNQRLMKDFMRICGPTATELGLFFDNSSTMNFTRRSFPDLNLSKLKSLQFNCGNYRGRSLSSQTHEIPYLVEVILDAAENLQEFRFEFPPRDVKSQNSVVRRFAEIIPHRVPKSVKMLRLNMWLNDSHLNTLIEADLKLEEFQFDCHATVGKDVIRRLLEQQSNSLKVLKVLSSDPCFPVSLDFPRFYQLRHMELQGANISPFSFPETFPKLETLNLTEWKTEKNVMDLFKFTKTAHSVKEIYFPSRLAQAALVKKAANCFPNIKTVHIAPSPDIAEALQDMFVYLSEIEELYISFPFLLDNELNVDSLFSGVSEQERRRICKQRDFDNVDIKDVQTKPSITNLKRLKKLVLDDSASDVVLTDFSAHFVFMKMESLSELHTSRFRMSSKYLDILRGKLTLKLSDDDFSEFSSDDSFDSDNGWHTDSSNDELQIIPFLGFGFNVFFVR